jgi:hypothetical protein
MLYLLEIDGSKAAVKEALASGLLVDYCTSNGLGGGAGAGQLIGITRTPFWPLEKAITTDASRISGATVYRFAAGKHGYGNITPLETAEQTLSARNLIAGGKRRRR